MRGRYLLEAPTELLEQGKQEAKWQGVSFAQLLRDSLQAALGNKERLAEPGKDDVATAESLALGDSDQTAQSSIRSGSASPFAPSKPAPTLELCGFRNPLAPVEKCSLQAGHEGRHTFA